MHKIALSLPALGMIGVLVLVGLRLGPWLPLGVTVATVMFLLVGQHFARPPRDLASDSCAIERWRAERFARSGRFLGTMTGVWLSLSAVLLTLLIVVALVSR
ncbi:MAG TPA: hypothetical protein VFW85_04320 [Gaiellaceae bacterium]|nr:hypothetical protein [Gaiellaceae bacterium]